MTGKNLLSTAIESTFLSMIADIHTCLPGTIETYDYKKRKATVKPLIKKKYIEGDTQELPILVNVPIVFPCSKIAGVVFPLSRGDGVLIVFSERALERWKSSGNVVEPGDPRKFDLSDGIAIPGLFSFKQNSFASNNNDLEVANKGQTITIKKNGDIDIGGTPVSKLVNESFMTLFNAHTHLSAAPGIPTATPLPLMTALNLTSKVKAQ